MLGFMDVQNYLPALRPIMMPQHPGIGSDYTPAPIQPNFAANNHQRMQPQNTSAEQQYKTFFQKVAANDEVWGLEGEEGLAISSSSKEEERDVIPFWSEETLAQAVAADEWAGFKPSPMPLAEFLENWLAGMHNDEILVGTDWDRSLEGKEVEPLVLALDLASEAQATGKTLEFSNYKDIEDFRKQVREASGL
jgi:hypothetical protein